MLNFLGGLIGAGANLFGGLLGQQNQQAINQQNINEANFMAQNRVQMTVADANKAGINPLTALGAQTFTPPSIQTGNSLGEGIQKSGQDIGRALSALQENEATRRSQLEEELLQAQIDSARVGITHQQLINSKLATNVGAPGNPSTQGVPLPVPNPLYTPEIVPAATRYLFPNGKVWVGPSRQFTEGSFSSIPGVAPSLGLSGALIEANDPSPRVVDVGGAAQRAVTPDSNWWLGE